MIERLGAGDEHAFRQLVEQHWRGLCHVAMTIVRDVATAEEVVQETWMAVIAGLSRFEQRSSLKTWIYRILINQARKRAKRDARVSVWSEISERPIDDEVSPLNGRFDHKGHWSAPPPDWGIDPEEAAIQRAMVRLIGDALETLPQSQACVVRLRDVEGFSSGEVCELLEISAGNQRVLLHRGRTAIRAYVERHIEETRS